MNFLRVMQINSRLESIEPEIRTGVLPLSGAVEQVNEHNFQKNIYNSRPISSLTNFGNNFFKQFSSFSKKKTKSARNVSTLCPERPGISSGAVPEESSKSFKIKSGIWLFKGFNFPHPHGAPSHVSFLHFLCYGLQIRRGVGVLLVGHLDSLVVHEIVHFTRLRAGHGLVEPAEPARFQVRGAVESAGIVGHFAAARKHQAADETDDQRSETRHHHGDRERLGRVNGEHRLGTGANFRS